MRGGTTEHTGSCEIQCKIGPLVSCAFNQKADPGARSVTKRLTRCEASLPASKGSKGFERVKRKRESVQARKEGRERPAERNGMDVHGPTEQQHSPITFPLGVASVCNWKHCVVQLLRIHTATKVRTEQWRFPAHRCMAGTSASVTDEPRPPLAREREPKNLRHNLVRHATPRPRRAPPSTRSQSTFIHPPSLRTLIRTSKRLKMEADPLYHVKQLFYQGESILAQSRSGGR